MNTNLHISRVPIDFPTGLPMYARLSVRLASSQEQLPIMGI